MEQVLQRLPSPFTMHWLEGADHGYRVQKRSGRTEEAALEEIGDISRAWVVKTLGIEG
jgi:hypothetical protein